MYNNEEELNKRLDEIEKVSDEMIRNLVSRGFVRTEEVMDLKVAGITNQKEVTGMIINMNNKRYFVTIPKKSGTFINGGSNYLEITGSNLKNGDDIEIFSTGTLPTGLSPGIHFVRDASAGRFRVSGFPGGAAISISGNGQGVHYYYG